MSSNSNRVCSLGEECMCMLEFQADLLKVKRELHARNIIREKHLALDLPFPVKIDGEWVVKV